MKGQQQKPPNDPIKVQISPHPRPRQAFQGHTLNRVLKKLLVDLSIDRSLPAEEAGTILVHGIFFIPGFPHGTEEGKAEL